MNPQPGDRVIISVAMDWRGQFGDRVSVMQAGTDVNIGPVLSLFLSDIVNVEMVSRHNDISADKTGTIRWLPLRLYEIEAIAVKRHDGSWMVMTANGGMARVPSEDLQQEATNGNAPVICHVRDIRSL